jgi:hypothetical protein
MFPTPMVPGRRNTRQDTNGAPYSRDGPGMSAPGALPTSSRLSEPKHALPLPFPHGAVARNALAAYQSQAHADAELEAAAGDSSFVRCLVGGSPASASSTSEHPSASLSTLHAQTWPPRPIRVTGFHQLTFPRQSCPQSTESQPLWPACTDRLRHW